MDKGFVLHWDGKMMLDIQSSDESKAERLPIVGSQCDSECILRVPKLPDKTGRSAALAVHNTLAEYGLLDTVQAVCTDTEASNTGNKNGSVVILEELLDRTLLYLACKHHMYELVLKAVFVEKCMGGQTKNPKVEMFERLKDKWNDFDLDSFDAGTMDDTVKEQLSEEFVEEMRQFCLHNLEKDQCRADYREFLELVVIFLDGDLPGGNRLKKPGPMHHARWMSKGIASLKIFLLRNQFTFKDEEEFEGLRDVCIFLIRLYVKAWFKATSAIEAPRLDLTFIKESIEYGNIDGAISRIALNKIAGHLWYLSQEAVALAFFDDEVTIEEKRKMVLALEKQKRSVKVLTSSEKELRRKYKSKDISDFVSNNTSKFFERFDISTDFLSVDPSEWNDRDDYQKGRETCKGIHIVNDAAERAVKLFTRFNAILSKDEEEKQFIIIAVQHYNKLHSSIKKSHLG